MKKSTLQQITEQELAFLKNDSIKAAYLAKAIQSKAIVKRDIEPARQLLAEFYVNSKQFGSAAIQYALNGDASKTIQTLFLETNLLIHNFRQKEAAKIFVNMDEIDFAIRAMCSTRTPSLEEILELLPGERVKNIKRILSDPYPHYGLKANCQAELGAHDKAARLELRLEHPDYNWAIQQFELAGDYEAAAETCLKAQADPWGSAIINKSGYSFSAYEFLLKAKLFDKAISICLNQLSGWTGTEDKIHDVYIASGVKEKEAWKMTAETIIAKASRYSQLMHGASYAYEKAGMPKEAGDFMLEKHYLGGQLCLKEPYKLFIYSGMTRIEAAKRILAHKDKLHDWESGDFFVLAEMWQEAINSYEKQRETCNFMRDERWDEKLAPLYEKVGRWADAADSYEQIGKIKEAITCRKKA